jgi:hypothetical protein
MINNCSKKYLQISESVMTVVIIWERLSENAHLLLMSTVSPSFPGFPVGRAGHQESQKKTWCGTMAIFMEYVINSKNRCLHCKAPIDPQLRYALGRTPVLFLKLMPAGNQFRHYFLIRGTTRKAISDNHTFPHFFA